MKYFKSAAASLAILASFGLVQGAAAQDSRVAVDAGIGTTGLSGNVQFALNRQFVIRGGYNYLAFDMDDQSYDDISYDTELDFNTVGGFLDVHPFTNAFTLTAGVFQGAKELNFNAMPTNDVEIGDMTFTPEEVGMLSGTATMEETAGYLGLGYDNALYGSGRWSFFLRGGVMFAGSPQIDLEASGGTLSDNPDFQAELAEEEQNVQDDVDDYDMYPVVSVGISAKL